MKSCLRILAVAIIGVAAISMIGCAGPAGFSYQNASITLTPFCENCPDGVIYNPAYPVPSPESGTFAIAIGAAGGTAGAAGAPALPNSVMLMPGSAGPGSTFWFQADVTNVPPNLTWAIYPTPDFGDITALPSGTSTTEGGTAGNNVYNYGSLVSASGNIAYFYEQSGLPTYTGGPALQQALAMGIPQGDVLLPGHGACRPSNPSVGGCRESVDSNIQSQRKPGHSRCSPGPQPTPRSHHQRCDRSSRHQLSVTGYASATRPVSALPPAMRFTKCTHKYH